MSSKGEDPHWGLPGVGFSDKDVSARACRERFLMLPENTGLLSQLSWQLSLGRDCSDIADVSFFLFNATICCNSILQSSCWSDFSWDGVVSRARTLHLPSSTLLPAACGSFCTLLIVKNSGSLKISLDIISPKSGCHVVPLSFKILSASSICPWYERLALPFQAHLNCKGDLWVCSTVHVNKIQIAFSGMSFAHSSFQDQILLEK